MKTRTLLVVVCMLFVAVPAAHADGDPASDYLLGLKTFIPPDSGFSTAQTNALNAVVTTALSRGYEIRVAVLATRYDMGSVGVLYGKPRLYARFLSEELAFVYKGRVLVVMGAGLGVARSGQAVPKAQTILDAFPAPGTSATSLANAAIQGVVRLAASNGVRVPAHAAPSSSSPSATTDRVAIAVGGVLLAAIAALPYLRRRLTRARR